MSDATALPQPRRRPVPRRVREAIRLLVEGDCKTISAAAKRAACSREYLSRSLNLPHVSAFLLEKIQRHVAVGGARGAARMVKLVDAAKSERTQFESARFLLGVAGVKVAADANVNINVQQTAGYVIMLGEPGGPEIKVVAGAEPTALPEPTAEN